MQVLKKHNFVSVDGSWIIIFFDLFWCLNIPDCSKFEPNDKGCYNFEHPQHKTFCEHLRILMQLRMKEDTPRKRFSASIAQYLLRGEL